MGHFWGELLGRRDGITGVGWSRIPERTGARQGAIRHLGSIRGPHWPRWREIPGIPAWQTPQSTLFRHAACMKGAGGRSAGIEPCKQFLDNPANASTSCCPMAGGEKMPPSTSCLGCWNQWESGLLRPKPGNRRPNSSSTNPSILRWWISRFRFERGHAWGKPGGHESFNCFAGSINPRQRWSSAHGSQRLAKMSEAWRPRCEKVPLQCSTDHCDSNHFWKPFGASCVDITKTRGQRHAPISPTGTIRIVEDRRDPR